MSKTKEELMLLKKSEIVAMCKEKGLHIYNGKTQIKKEAMIDLLLECENADEAKPEEVEETFKPINSLGLFDGDEKDEDSVNDVNSNEPWVLGGKDDLIQKAEVGTLIAFIDDKGKPRTGKMVNRSASRKIVKIETEFNWTFLVPYDKVLWVRFGTRWPKAIYNMLKEYKNGRKPNVVAKIEEEH